jgi:hypothetical protein
VYCMLQAASLQAEQLYERVEVATTTLAPCLPRLCPLSALCRPQNREGPFLALPIPTTSPSAQAYQHNQRPQSDLSLSLFP